MKKILLGTAVLLLSVPTLTLAGSPDEPGVFGRDRSDIITGGYTGKVWGAEAAARAGTNGEQNQAYKTVHKGDPNPENDNGGGNDDE